MKKLFLIIIGLCLCTALYADMNTYIIGGGSAGGDYVITDGYVYISSNYASTAILISIYSSDGTHVATSNTTSIPGSLPGWAHVTFTGGPTLSPGSTYYLSESSNGFLVLRCSGGTWNCQNHARGDWPSGPSAIVPGSDSGVKTGEFGIYVTNTSGTLLLGNNTSGDFGSGCDFQQAASDSFYFSSGYTCVTQ